MATIKLHLLVLKTRQLDRLKAFYAALGIAFAEEKHGDGPTHYAGRVGEALLELYPLPEDAGPADTTTRLGFAVSDLDTVVGSLEAAGGVVASPPRRTAWGYRAVVRDPDGRAVELCRSRSESEPLSRRELSHPVPQHAFRHKPPSPDAEGVCGEKHARSAGSEVALPGRESGSLSRFTRTLDEMHSSAETGAAGRRRLRYDDRRSFRTTFSHPDRLPGKSVGFRRLAESVRLCNRFCRSTHHT